MIFKISEAFSPLEILFIFFCYYYASFATEGIHDPGTQSQLLEEKTVIYWSV